MASRPTPPEALRSKTWPLALALILVGAAVASALAAGAYDVPRNDDWAFARITRTFFDDGRLELVGWNAMAFVGQLLWAAPVVAIAGTDLTALRVAIALAAVLALLCAYELGHSRGGRALGLWAVACLGTMAPFSVLSTSYMTDIPALALALGSLVAGERSLRAAGRGRTTWLICALLLGLWAFSIRETALAAPVGVLVAVAAQERSVRRAAIGAAGLLVGVLVLFLWRRSLPHGGGFPTPFVVDRHTLVTAARAVSTLGLLALPALVAVVPALLRRDRTGTLVGAVAGLLLVVVILAAADGVHDLLAGNVLTRYGEMGTIVLLGDRAPALPRVLWLPLQALAGLGTAVIGAALVVLVRRRSWLRRPDDLGLAVAAALTVAMFFVLAATGESLFDRYLLLPAVLVVVLAGPIAASGRLWSGAAVATLAVLAVATALLVENTHRYAAARWSAGERLVALGYDPRDVDAGFEWMGWHHRGPAFLPEGAPIAAAPASGYTGIFPGSRNCALVAGSGQSAPGLEPAGTVTYANRPGRTSTLHLYRYPGACP